MENEIKLFPGIGGSSSGLALIIERYTYFRGWYIIENENDLKKNSKNKKKILVKM